MNLTYFFYNYFIEPYTTFGGYNLVNTLVYGIITIGVLVGLFKIMKKYFKFDAEFFHSIIPYIIFGSAFRDLVDNNVLPYTPFTVSPGAWITLTAITFFSLMLGKLIEVKFKKKKFFFYFGIVLDLIILSFLIPLSRNIIGFFLVILVFLAVSFVYIFIVSKLKIKFLLEKLSFYAMLGHLFDASATFVGIDFFGLSEQHVLTRFFGEISGTYFVFFILKILVVGTAVYYISKDVKEKELGNWLKIAVAILGFGTGIRDTFMILTLT